MIPLLYGTIHRSTILHHCPMPTKAYPSDYARTSVLLQGHVGSSLLPTALLYGPYPLSTGGPSTVQDICVMEDPSSIDGGLYRVCRLLSLPIRLRLGDHPLCLAPSLRHSRPSPPPLCLRPRCRTRTGASGDLRHYPWTLSRVQGALAKASCVIPANSFSCDTHC